MTHNFIMRLITVSFLLCLSQISIAQPITVVDGNTNPYTPENLITNVFLGQGLTVTSVNYFGDPLSVGYFDDAQSYIGIQRGVVMSSGKVSSENGGVGLDNQGSAFASYNSQTVAGDADLAAILNGIPEQDVCKYIISFIPTSDTVEFNFVFASEEYPEFACQDFNDVFGFFISGPGINGPFQNNAENIALIPNTNIPVSINTVHPANGVGCPPSNEEFYIDNNNSDVNPVYDGYTQVFTARAVVTPCEEYTIKLAIADGLDEIYDSSVFLEAKSFGTGTINVSLNTLSLNGVLAEACSEGEILFSVENAPENDFIVDLEVFGTATDGDDYASFPAEVIIPAGETSTSIPFIAFEDNLAEDEEFIGLAVQRDACNLDTFYLYIRDNELPDLDLGPDLEICELTETILTGELDVELPDPPSFTNEQDYLISPVGEIVASEIEVFGVLPAELQEGVIQSVCLNVDHNWLSDLDIYLQSPDGLFMELVTNVGSNGDDFVETCFVPGAPVAIDYISSPATGAPYTGEFSPEGVWSDLGYGSSTNGTWTLLVIDDSEGFQGTLLDWTITFAPEYDLFYSWSPAEGLDCTDCPNPNATPDVTTEYYLEVSDSYGCSTYDTLLVEVIQAFEAPNVSCLVTSADCIEFSWDPISGAVGYLVSVDNAPFIASNGTTSHTVCGINLNTEVQIEVVAFDFECNGDIGYSSCTTPDCDGAIPDIENIAEVSCFGATDGAIEISATGLFPPFEFTLNGETNSSGDFFNLTAGVYSIDILDNGGCLESYDFEVPSPDLLIPSISLDQSISCNGASDAVLSADVIGGTGPYNFIWSSGNSNNESVSEVGPGLLALELIDANGCVSDTAIQVEEPQALIAIGIDDFVPCQGDETGTASVIVNGGSFPYSYSWDVSPIDTNAIYNLSSGTYSVVVTDASMCTSNVEVNIAESAPIIVDFVSTPVSCGDGGDGTLTAVPSGGLVGIFIFEWDANAGGGFNATATDLDAGNYSVTISDLAGCEVEASGIVQSNEDIQLEVNTLEPGCWYTDDGQAEIEVVLGTYPYTFTWSDGLSTDSLRNDLMSGTYFVTVADDDQCEAIAQIDLISPDSIDLSFNTIDPTCDSFSDGEIVVSASGGAGSYSYDWGGGNNTETLSNVPSGLYSVTVLDGNLCEQTGEIELMNPDQISLDLIITDANCFSSTDGSVQVVPSPGPISDYTISWVDGQNSFTAIGLGFGDYGFTVENTEGCTQDGIAAVSHPDALVLDFDTTDDSCVNSPAGEVNAIVTGGTEPYNYSWDGLSGNSSDQTGLLQGVYSLTVVDDNGCAINGFAEINAPEPFTFEVLPIDTDCFEGQNGSASINVLTGGNPVTYTWSNNTSDPVVSNLNAGTYTVTVIDENDCTSSNDFEIEQPAQITAEFDLTNPACYDSADGVIEVTEVGYGGISADPANFDFNWLVINQNGLVANGLEGDTYTVLITDVLGCVKEEELTLVSPTEMIQVIEIETPVSCIGESDGSLLVTTFNGTGPYDYQWGSNSNNQIGNIASNLIAGTYEVSVTDANGCLSEASFDLPEPEAFAYTYLADSVSCYGYSDGQATLFVEGANNSYTYDWGNQSGQSATNLAAGVYAVTVTDIVGCSFVAEVEVGSPTDLLSSYFTEDVDCYGQNNGMIGIEIEGGSSPYEYTLYPVDDNQADNVFENLGQGVYEVVVEDSKGCSYSFENININEPAPLLVDLGSDTLLQDLNTFTIEANISNETPVVEYNWTLEGPAIFESTIDNIANLSDIDGRTYVQLQVIDENGCVEEDYMNVFVRREAVVMLPTAFTPNDDNNNDVLYVHGSKDLKVLSFQVFDRWGDLIFQRDGEFEINDSDLNWDGTFNGKEMESGSYLWYVLVQLKDGTTESFEGSTLLIR